MHKILIALFFLSFTVNAQNNYFMTAFWNVENLFDTVDQPGVDDAEFLPGSEKQWDHIKFNRKIINLSTVIMSMNSGQGPDILGLCEVENQAVVESLVVYLRPEFKIIHMESPDGRGIDNALIFRGDLFKLVSLHSDTVYLGPGEKTRSILWSRLSFRNRDTISVFVNHWPSRRGGADTEQKRILAAKTLKKRMDTQKNNDFLIAMGDFNDEPENISLDSVLNAGTEGGTNNYVNLAYQMSLNGEGSYKYRDTWNMLDQIIVSGNTASIRYQESSFEVYKPDFTITKSGNYAGTPIPTFGGKKYLGGFSDHFPVTAKFIVRN